MKKLYVLLATCLLMVFAGCGSKKSQAYYDYKSKVIATELDGSYTIRAFGRARNAVDAYEQARKQAVRDVIFTGVDGVGNQNRLSPLCYDMNAQTKYEEYFAAFFADGGEYTKYANFKEKHVETSRWARTEAGSLAEVTVCVNRLALKKKLQADGIIKVANE